MNRIRAVLERYERIPRWLRFTAVVLWAWMLWWLSSRRGSDLEGVRVGGFITNGAHVAFFGVLAGLVFLAGVVVLAGLLVGVQWAHADWAGDQARVREAI